MSAPSEPVTAPVTAPVIGSVAGAGHRVAVVVGGSSGIGLATARRLCQAGYRVVIAARSRDGLAAAARAVGPPVETIPVDLLDADSVQGLVDEVLSRHGRIDVVVATAQAMAYGRIDQVPADVFERTVEIAVHGTARLARAVLPVFRRQGGGSFIGVNSLLGEAVVPALGSYTTAKWGQLALLRTLQLETRDEPGIHVSIVSPGATDTPIYDLAANYTGRRTAPPPPVVPPDTVACAIIDCLDRPRRHVEVGIGNRAMVLAFRALPAVFDRLVGPLSRLVILRGSGVPATPGNVREPTGAGEGERGGWSALSLRRRGARRR